jgi:uncharacterized LabA/DUF88 family protein
MAQRRDSSGRERVAVFIDGANLHYAARGLGFQVDFAALLDFFGSSTYLVRAYYYTAMLETEDYNPVRRLADWLGYNGYRVVSKPAKDQTDTSGRRFIKGNMDVDLAVDMMEMAASVDHVVLFSGDGDFRSLVEAIQRKGVRVSVVSTVATQPPMVADELRRQADEFIDIAHLIPRIGRDGGDRTQRFDRRPPSAQDD